MRLLLAVVLLIAAPWPSSAQTLAPAPPAATLSATEMEKFLLDGRIVKKKESSKGVTQAYRVTLSNGELTHDAQVQNVDIYKPYFDVGPKKSEVNFKDSYRYNVAAYRLAVLLGLDNVPMSVERIVDGKPAAMTWWLDGVMDDGDRRKKKISQSNPLRASDYYGVMYVFDELIQNRDRNQGNIVWSPDSRMWMIDHTRAFRTGKDLYLPANLMRVERTLFERMRALDRQAFTESVGKMLTKDEIDAMFVRRDKLVQLFDQKIASLGEDKILYTIR
jgi:DNA mismatch repair protein, C-terminal domain